MNKAELIRTVAEKSGLSRKDAAGAVRAMLEAIPEELKSGGNVQLIGFGTFCMQSGWLRCYRRKACEARKDQRTSCSYTYSCETIFASGINYTG